MGVDYRGVVCVGYTYEQVEKLKEQAGFEGDFYEFVESEDFQSFAPYFDADKEYCIYGYYVVQSQDYCKQKVDLHKSASVAENLSAGLLIEYGMEPGTYIMAAGT